MIRKEEEQLIKAINRTTLKDFIKYLESRRGYQLTKLEHVKPEDLLVKQGKLSELREIINDLTFIVEKS